MHVSMTAVMAAFIVSFTCTCTTATSHPVLPSSELPNRFRQLAKNKNKRKHKPSAAPSSHTGTETPTLLPTSKPTKPTKHGKKTTAPTVTQTSKPTTAFPTPIPTTAKPTTAWPTRKPTTAKPTTPTTSTPSTRPTTKSPTSSAAPTTTTPTIIPTTATKQPTSLSPTTTRPTMVNETYSPTYLPTTSTPSSRPTHAPTSSHPSTSPSRSPFVLVTEQWGDASSCPMLTPMFQRPYQLPNHCEYNFLDFTYEYRTCKTMIVNRGTCSSVTNGSIEVVTLGTCIDATLVANEYEVAHNTTTTSNTTVSLARNLTCETFDGATVKEFVKIDYYLEDVACSLGQVAPGGIFRVGDCYETSQWAMTISSNSWGVPQYFTITEFGLVSQPFDMKGCLENLTSANPVAMGDLRDVLANGGAICLPVITPANGRLRNLQTTTTGSFKITSLPSILHNLEGEYEPVPVPTMVQATVSPTIVTSPTPSTLSQPTHSPMITPSPATTANAPTGEPTQMDVNGTVNDASAWGSFYDALGGSSWTRCSGERLSPCRCSGVTCVLSAQYVGGGAVIQAIVLPHNNLVGMIPVNSLNLMKGLTKLDLSGNSGLKVPPLTQCVNLIVCEKQTCMLDSQIPICQLNVTLSPATVTASPNLGPVVLQSNNGLSSGDLAAAILVPIIVVCLCLAVLWLWKRDKENTKFSCCIRRNRPPNHGSSFGGQSSPPPSRPAPVPQASASSSSSPNRRAGAGGGTGAGDSAASNTEVRRRPTPQAPISSTPPTVWLAPVMGQHDEPHGPPPPSSSSSSQLQRNVSGAAAAPTRPTSSKPKITTGRPEPSSSAPPTKKSSQHPQFDSSDDNAWGQHDPFASTTQRPPMQQHNTSNPFDE